MLYIRWIRRYELDGDSFKWSTDQEKDSNPSDIRIIPMSRCFSLFFVVVSSFDYSFPFTHSVIEIRYNTNDANLLKESQHCFEFETNERTFALGCDTAAEKVFGICF